MTKHDFLEYPTFNFNSKSTRFDFDVFISSNTEKLKHRENFSRVQVKEDILIRQFYVLSDMSKDDKNYWDYLNLICTYMENEVIYTRHHSILARIYFNKNGDVPNVKVIFGKTIANNIKFLTFDNRPDLDFIYQDKAEEALDFMLSNGMDYITEAWNSHNSYASLHKERDVNSYSSVYDLIMEKTISTKYLELVMDELFYFHKNKRFFAIDDALNTWFEIMNTWCDLIDIEGTNINRAQATTVMSFIKCVEVLHRVDGWNMSEFAIKLKADLTELYTDIEAPIDQLLSLYSDVKINTFKDINCTLLANKEIATPSIDITFS